MASDQKGSSSSALIGISRHGAMNSSPPASMDPPVAAATRRSAAGDGDASAPYELLLSCPLGLSPSQVSAEFDGSHDRVPRPDLDLENSISEIWDQRIQRNASLYNGTKFRYAGFITRKEGSGSNKISWVSLHLGLTDYRTFVGTNLNPLWERFLVPSTEDTIRCQNTSSPLGNGAIVETLDKKILVLRRSDNVGEFPGHFVFPGGHPEPQEIGIACHQPGKSLRESEMLNKRVSEEMFDSIVREVNEEIGVPGSSLGNPLFIGLSRRKKNVRPTAFFFMTCTLHSDEIQKCYSSAQDGFESTQLYAVTLIDLENLASKMPGCHQGGLALYKLMLEAGKDAG